MNGKEDSLKYFLEWAKKVPCACENITVAPCANKMLLTLAKYIYVLEHLDPTLE